MTIDERLEKLAERHEGLAQTVEIIAGMQKENERLFERMFAENERRFAGTDKRFGPVLEFVTQLGSIAEAHDHRLGRLEGR